MRIPPSKRFRHSFALLLTLIVGASAAIGAFGLQRETMDHSASTSGLTPDRPANSLAEACLLDLEAIAPFLLANDAGAQQAATDADQTRRSAALQAAREEARSVQDESQCIAVLRRYLGAWRRGHLFVQAITPGGTESVRPELMPSIELRSPSTAVITAATFDSAAREPLLAALERHRTELEERPNWIIDVRGNSGGSDTTWAPLLPWLMPDGWIDVSQRVFVTGTNLHAEERLVQEISKTDREGAEALAHVVQRMRGAGDGHWVQQEYDGGWSYERPARLELRRPQRVAVLIDRRCGSACEQFLLTVRQSYPVKLVGRSPTYGGLDVSNLRPHLLPSGKHRLWYAITMSNRLPALPIDGIGIAPDVFLPDPEDTGDRDADVRRTQRWLEGGGW